MKLWKWLPLALLLAACTRSAPVAATPKTRPAPATATAPYQKPVPIDPTVAALIDQMASDFPPDYPRTGNPFTPDPDNASERDGQRIQASREKLKSMGVAAFPDLVASVGDPRFSHWASGLQLATGESVQGTVGGECYSIIAEQVGGSTGRYIYRKGAQGRGGLNPDYLGHMKQDPGLAAWWDARKSRTLRELQIEALEWTRQQENDLGFTDDAQRHEILDPLEKRLAEVRASK